MVRETKESELGIKSFWKFINFIESLVAKKFVDETNYTSPDENPNPIKLRVESILKLEAVYPLTSCKWTDMEELKSRFDFEEVGEIHGTIEVICDFIEEASNPFHDGFSDVLVQEMRNVVSDSLLTKHQKAMIVDDIITSILDKTSHLDVSAGCGVNERRV